MNLLAERSVTYDADGVTAELVIHTSTTLISAVRSILISDAQRAGETDPARALVRQFVYPDLIACATGTVNGQDVTTLDFETFLALPERFVIQWEKAVGALNGHWLPEVVAEAKKEVTPSTAD